MHTIPDDLYLPIFSRLDRRRQKTPVDTNIRASHKAARRRRSQKDRRPHQFLRPSEAIHRCMGKDLATALGRAAVLIKEQAAVLLSGEETRRDRIDPDPFFRPFPRQDLRQTDHRHTFLSINPHVFPCLELRPTPLPKNA